MLPRHRRGTAHSAARRHPRASHGAGPPLIQGHQRRPRTPRTHAVGVPARPPPPRTVLLQAPSRWLDPWTEGGVSQRKASPAVVEQVVRLPFQEADGGANPTPRLQFTSATTAEIAPLLSAGHYLGPVKSARLCFAGFVDDALVCAMAWRWPTARMLPSDGTWLELTRWCLTPQAGKNAGSRMMRWVATQIRRDLPGVTTGVSYSDPTHHTGSLYKCSGWNLALTHHGARFLSDGIGYASGHGSWDGVTKQAPKIRWTYPFARAAA